MGHAVGNEEFRARVEVKERIHLVAELSLLMPKHPALATAPDLGVCYHVAALHGGEVRDGERLAHRNAVSPVALQHDSVAAVKLEPVLLEVDIKRYLGAVVRRHHEVLAIKLVAHDLRATY